MCASIGRKIFLFTFYSLIAAGLTAQVQCPPNIDFEMGNFNNWECRTGTVSAAGGINNITWGAGTDPVFNRHTIISAPNTDVDQYGSFPVLCPNGSGYSVKLGNNTGGAQAEGLFYTYAIPATATNFTIVYNYAVVLQSPNHNPYEQPRFRSLIVNLTDNQTLDCVEFDFNPGGSLPGFQAGPNQVMYKGWTPITLDLSAYAGKTIQLQFMTSDCTFAAHFGYAYVDVNATCDEAVIGSTICIGDPEATLTAPYGFDTYTWYADNSFSQIIGTGQSLVLNPAPTAPAVLPVIITPFPGYGCVDTVYATLTLAQKPPSNAGTDAIACPWEQIPIGTASNPLYTYLWSPAQQVVNPTASSSTGFITNIGPPKEFIVTTTDPVSGCFSRDTVVITPKIYDTALTVTGKTEYCSGETLNTSFSINNTSNPVQWYQTNTPIGGANGTTFVPSITGDYWAQYTQMGCLDSSRVIHFDVFPLPVVDFSVNRDTQCITNNSFAFINNSNISDGSNLSYLWTFSDGTTSSIAAPVKSINTIGTWPVKLLVSSANNCKDSLSDLLYVLPNVIAGFDWDLACTNKVTQFTNLTKENGSSQVSYAWDFGNNTSSLLKNPAAFRYDSAALYTVTLKATALGCETDVQTLSKQVHVHAIRKGFTYPSITVPSGYSSIIYALFDSAGASYKWVPGTQLNNSNIKAPNFFAINDVLYNITITDKDKCVTIDTLQMLVLKNKGWYLPNAFTPNGDGLNDVVRPYLIGMKSLSRFSIYNRLGNLVFTTKRNGEGWDGNYNGRKLDGGAYVWILDYIDDNNKPVTQKGSLMLIR